MAGSRIEVETYVALLDHMFEETAADFGRDHWHSLMRNLSTVRDEDWTALPSGGGRTIREIAVHIGAGYPWYASQAFGDGSWEWSAAPIDGVAVGTTPDELKAWLSAGFATFRAGVSGLTDDQLDAPITPWGPDAPITVRRAIELQIQTTFYHVGEINHIRALLQGNDDWDHQDMDREDEE